MTYHPTKSHAGGEYLSFDHIHFWVGNAYQAASFYVSRFGFEPLVFRGLETGSRSVMTQVVRQGNITFAFSSALEPGNHEMYNHLMRHGDSVKDVAFTVDDCHAVFNRAVDSGAVVISPPEILQDEHGCCVVATIAAPYADVWHTFVERSNYEGRFLPGYRALDMKDPLADLFDTPRLDFVDHCVCNQPDGQMEPVVDWYVDTLGFHRFWSVDDSQIHTQYSSLRSVVVADRHERVKMPINEPAEGLRRSQIQEFVDYNAGAGIQHIALNTPDIISSISRLRSRGVTFVSVPDTYYEELSKRLKSAGTHLKEDLSILRELRILVDFDSDGYLLQIFTKPVQDRPTLFLEVIQRRTHDGFGVGNFKSLFEAIEREQARRGNL